MARPWGFKTFVIRRGFDSIYLITTETNSPIKVGIARDPLDRLHEIQTENFHRLRLHRAWWVAGRPVSKMVERAFKHHFRAQLIRGEWFDLPLPEAESFVEGKIRSLGTWGVPEADLIRLMEHAERRKHRLPPTAPWPTRGPRRWRY